MASRSPQPEDVLGSLEARVLRALWDLDEPAVVGEVLEHLNRGASRPLAYNSVMSVMSRLADKGLLTRHRRGRAYVYEPAVSQTTFAEREARRAADRFVREFGAAAVAGFVEAVRGEPELERRLRELLDRPRNATTS